MSTTHAEFYLSLARAFLAPGEATFEGFRRYLADDLDEMASELGLDVAEPVAALRGAMALLEEPLALMQLYSGLFVQPPRVVPINGSLYVDGAIMGRSVDLLEEAFARHGVARAEEFRDTPDHLAAQLEFLAVLHASAAEAPDPEARAGEIRDYIKGFLLPWVPMFVERNREAVEQRGCAPVYLHLARALQAALVHDAGELSQDLLELIDPAARRVAETRRREMACCRNCGAEIAPAGRVRRVRRVLEREGIDTSHLELCPNCRGRDPVLLRPPLEEDAGAPA